MSVTLQLTSELFKETIDRALKDVCRTMLTFNANSAPENGDGFVDGEPVSHAVGIPGERTIGTVGFIGELNGLLSLFVDDQLGVAIASRLLGMSPDEVKEAGHEVMNDTIGEITNMTAGAFKNQLADRGFPCRLTIPSILRGSSLSLEMSRGNVRRVYRYEVEGHILYVDFQLKDTNAA